MTSDSEQQQEEKVEIDSEAQQQAGDLDLPSPNKKPQPNPQETATEASTTGLKVGSLRVPWLAVCIMGIVLLAGIAAAVAVPLTQREVASPANNSTEQSAVDPFKSMNSEGNFTGWEVEERNGLKIEIVNALDEEWQEIFTLVVADYENGTPDALTIITNRVAPEDDDPDCEPISGKIKVCNGDYGPTNWRGITKVLFNENNGSINASAIRLNEFYFHSETNAAQRRYTLCHELGHGFGLPHTDENFYNANLGNCMDYTNRPETNQRPDESNFEMLQQMYGSVPVEDITTIPPKPAPTTVMPTVRRTMPPSTEQPSLFGDYGGDPTNATESPSSSAPTSEQPVLSEEPTLFLDGSEDPFDSMNPNDANLWRTNGTGLTIEIINALDEEWHEIFTLVVDDWEHGIPDALTLTISQVSPESQCNPVRGKIKVCNGDYGATNWMSINKILLENGWVIASAIRMNEFYFHNQTSEAARRYRMCHEFGHAFGLPHTDENFYNANLGNCMDYTNRPETNQSPDTSNFLFLQQLYGKISTLPLE